MLAALSRFLFGYDIFISYSYADGRQYADALEEKLTNLDFSCFLDRKELAYGDVLNASLRRAIRRSKALLLVGTRAAVTAPYVNLELSEAVTRGHTRVIPVDVDGIRERFSSPEVRELIWINEEDGAACARNPSATVLDAVVRHFRFTRRNSVTRRFVGASALFFFLLALVAVWQWREAVVQRDLAISRQLAAQAQTVMDSEPDLALLLAAEAAGTRDTFESRAALLATLQSRPGLVKLLHDAGRVRQLVFGSDDRLLSLATDHQVTVWDLSATRPSGRPATATEIEEFAVSASSKQITERVERLLARIRSTDGAVRAFAISPDDTVLATSRDAEVSLWRVPDGRRIGPARSAQQPYVRTLAFSPGGLLASGSSGGTIALWSVSDTPRPGRAVHGLRLAANSVTFSEDERIVAAGGYEGVIMRWDVATGRPIGAPLAGHRSSVRALRFCANGEMVSTASEVIRWDLRTHASVAAPLTLARHSAAAISPDCSLVAFGTNTGEIGFLDLSTGKVRGPSQQIHTDRIFAVAFGPRGTTVATAGNDRRIVLWDSRTATSTGPPLEGHRRPISGLAFNATGDTLASLDSDGTLIVWDVRGQRLVGRPLQRSAAYSAQSALALSPDARTAATSSSGGLVGLWDVETWRQLGPPLPGHPGDVTAFSFSPSGRYLASAGTGGTVIVWDLRVETWIDAARSIANRSLTPNEQEIYLRRGPVHRHQAGE